VFSVEERGRDMFAAAERLDLEGIVAKRKADRYRSETVWYKIKSRTYTQGEGAVGAVPKAVIPAC
jgi:ATP-dependent DNA ligase